MRKQSYVHRDTLGEEERRRLQRVVDRTLDIAAGVLLALLLAAVAVAVFGGGS